MNKHTVNQVLRGCLGIVFLLAAANLWSQPPQPKAKIALSSFGSKSKWQSEVQSALTKELQKSGWVKVVDFENSPDFVLFVQTARQDPSESGTRIFSLAVTQSLPAPWLDHLAKEEIPYKVMPVFQKKKLPKEGKFVREYVTRQMLQEYRYLLDLKSYAAAKDSLPQQYRQMARNALLSISGVWVRK